MCWDTVEGRIHGGDVADSDCTEFDEKLSWLRNKVKEIIAHRKNNKMESKEECLLDVLLDEEDYYSSAEECLVSEASLSSRIAK